MEYVDVRMKWIYLDSRRHEAKDKRKKKRRKAVYSGRHQTRLELTYCHSIPTATHSTLTPPHQHTPLHTKTTLLKCNSFETVNQCTELTTTPLNPTTLRLHLATPIEIIRKLIYLLAGCSSVSSHCIPYCRGNTLAP